MRLIFALPGDAQTQDFNDTILTGGTDAIKNDGIFAWGKTVSMEGARKGR